MEHPISTGIIQAMTPNSWLATTYKEIQIQRNTKITTTTAIGSLVLHGEQLQDFAGNSI